jgi:polar amino acid transport system substrate-binding protein
MTDLRMLAERFMVINQAMGVPKSKGLAAAVYLRHFVEEMKAKGFVKDAMTRHGIQGAGVGYAADPDKDPLDTAN